MGGLGGGVNFGFSKDGVEAGSRPPTYVAIVALVEAIGAEGSVDLGNDPNHLHPTGADTSGGLGLGEMAGIAVAWMFNHTFKLW